METNVDDGKVYSEDWVDPVTTLWKSDLSLLLLYIILTPISILLYFASCRTDLMCLCKGQHSYQHLAYDRTVWEIIRPQYIF